MPDITVTRLKSIKPYGAHNETPCDRMPANAITHADYPATLSSFISRTVEHVDATGNRPMPRQV